MNTKEKSCISMMFCGVWLCIGVDPLMQVIGQVFFISGLVVFNFHQGE